MVVFVLSAHVIEPYETGQISSSFDRKLHGRNPAFATLPSHTSLDLQASLFANDILHEPLRVIEYDTPRIGEQGPSLGTLQSSQPDKLSSTTAHPTYVIYRK